MPPSRPRLVRREPLISRIKAYLNPWDFLLWLSEELNGNDWEDFLKQWATPLGMLSNIVYMIARSNASGSACKAEDIFADYSSKDGNGWLAWMASLVVHFLTVLSLSNSLYAFTRRRHYRLFEASVNVNPSTPSARRVRVDSSPISSPPLRYLSHIFASTTAESRAHPDDVRDVWELAVWDPTPLCLRLFTLFSPGHVLVYWLFLPLAPLDPKPSVTVATTIFLAILLSAQLILLQKFFSQQSKDVALIHKEVQHEYDTKFVNPSLNRPVRDVGTQMNPETTPNSVVEVNTYTPTTFVNRGFRTNPNPNYASYYDPDGASRYQTQPQGTARAVMTPKWRTPDAVVAYTSPSRVRDAATIRQPQFRSSIAAVPSGDGGTFGIHSHAHSPLKRTSAATLGRSGLDGMRERTPFVREGSPLKRSSMSVTVLPNGGRHDRMSHVRGDDTRKDSDTF